jgi:hypothetical protein
VVPRVLPEGVLSRALQEGVVPRVLPEGVVPRALPEGVVPHTLPADDQLVMRLEDIFPAGHEVVSRTVRAVERGIGITAFGGIIIGIPASGVPTGGGGDGMGIHIIRTATDTTTTITTIRDPVILMVHRTVIMAAIRHR